MVGIASVILFGQATGGEGVAARLASVAQHTFPVRLTILFGLLQAVCAIVLGVTLYRLTRDQDSDLALLALIFRVCEGLLGAISTRAALELLWLGAGSRANSLDSATMLTVGTYLLNRPAWNMGAIFFAMGSTLFSYLLLRGKIIPISLAWLGVIASVILLVGLPLELAGVVRGSVTSFLWIPMLIFEVPLGIWLLIKGVRVQPTSA